ncbi:hypothetical protein [Nocardioides terrisoli]|uniref:hypothetical protein n=1 Tax=Nocardioides terrisoli TaxID=3388267 RepID=UPI00287B6ACF|nr:hypothetical protein [Nocardioides marmorisolisilvae]
MTDILAERAAGRTDSAPSEPTRGIGVLRTVAALGAFGESAAHIPVIQEHLTEAPYIGVGFVLLTVAGLYLGNLLLREDSTWVWLATGVVAAAALVGYVTSRTIGLPQIHDDIGNWGEPLGVVAVVSEALMLVAVLARMAGDHPGGLRRQ